MLVLCDSSSFFEERRVANPFAKRKITSFRHETKSESTQAGEVADLEKTYELEDTKERFDYAAKILKEHGGLEAQIPINHPYWRIRP